jgi:hypothetical protein
MTRTVTPTHVLLNQVTLAANASDVTFSGLPSNYKDLVVVCWLKGTSSTGGLTFQIRLNGDSGSNYDDVVMGATNGGAFSNVVNPGTGIRLTYSGSNGTETCFTRINLMDYRATDKHKHVIVRHAGTADGLRTDLFVGRWRDTAAVTSLTIRPDANSIASGSTVALYGVFG